MESLKWTFFAPLTHIISDFKLRASIGKPVVTGCKCIRLEDDLNWAQSNYIFSGPPIQGLHESIPVTNLSWVTSTSSNIVLTSHFLNQRSMSVRPLWKKAHGIPAAKYDVSTASEVGYTLPNENLNVTANKGMEAMISYNTKIGP